jgi:thiamine biosynthesis lipoprotein
MSRVILKGRSLELLPGTKLDLGGCLKGYAVRKSIELIGNMGLRRALVNGGGNIQALGEGADGKPWSVGIAHPRKSSAPLASIDLREGEGIATSGDYQRFFIHKGIRYSHLLDPAGGYPARRCISATVLARDAFAADFLSTAVFVLGPVKGISLLRRLGADGLIITEKGQVATEGMKRRLRPPAGEGQ